MGHHHEVSPRGSWNYVVTTYDSYSTNQVILIMHTNLMPTFVLTLLGHRTRWPVWVVKLAWPVCVIRSPRSIWVIGPILSHRVCSTRLYCQVSLIRLECLANPACHGCRICQVRLGLSLVWGWVRRISNSTFFEDIWIPSNLTNWNTSKVILLLSWKLCIESSYNCVHHKMLALSSEQIHVIYLIASLYKPSLFTHE